MILTVFSMAIVFDMYIKQMLSIINGVVIMYNLNGYSSFRFWGVCEE